MASTRENPQRIGAHVQERTGLDWGNLRFFLELARTGSLSRAAQRLSVDRATVGRRIAALEQELGLELFERGPQGWTLTASGRELSELASRVEQDVLAIARKADAADRQELTGVVRLTTATHISAHLLAPALPSLRSAHPGLVLEIAADQRAFDLTRREADLALRMGRPRDAGLVTRKLTDIAYGFFASESLVGARREVDLGRDPFVAFDESLASTPQERWISKIAPERSVVFRCNSTASLAAAARSGVGVAILPLFVAVTTPDLVRLAGPVPVSHEMWLLVHGDLRRAPRVEAVIAWVDDLVRRARPRIAAE
jgi:DNA-binding transcriptional LysR family regulator